MKKGKMKLFRVYIYIVFIIREKTSSQTFAYYAKYPACRCLLNLPCCTRKTNEKDNVCR